MDHVIFNVNTILLAFIVIFLGYGLKIKVINEEFDKSAPPLIYYIVLPTKLLSGAILKLLQLIN